MPTLPNESVERENVLFRRILFATDFSVLSGRALPYAVNLSNRYGASVTVAHINPPITREGVSLDSLSRELDCRRREAEQAMKVFLENTDFHQAAHHELLEEGPLWGALSSIIRRENIDLLVLGTHGRGGVKKLLLGSLAEEVLHLAPCPVLIVGPRVPTPTSAAANPRIILFATDFGAPSVKAFPYALSLAEDFCAKLILLHMLRPRPAGDVGSELDAKDQLAKWENEVRQESTRRLRELLPLESRLVQEPECVVGIDFISEGILSAAAARQAELIVMGVRRTRLARAATHLPWSFIHDVVSEARCPVLTVGD